MLIFKELYNQNSGANGIIYYIYYNPSERINFTVLLLKIINLCNSSGVHASTFSPKHCVCQWLTAVPSLTIISQAISWWSQVHNSEVLCLAFWVSIDWIMWKTTSDKPRGIQQSLFSQLEVLDFADDLVVPSLKYACLQEKTNRLSSDPNRQVCTSVSLKLKWRVSIPHHMHWVKTDGSYLGWGTRQCCSRQEKIETDCHSFISH